MEKIFLDNPWVIMLILLWTLPWKGVALWIAARRGHIGWFLALLIVNSLALLDILYIFIFSKWGKPKNGQRDQEEKDQQNQQQESASRQPRFTSTPAQKNRGAIV